MHPSDLLTIISPPSTAAHTQPWFHGTEGNGTPWPKRYEVFPEPLPARSVRLLVIPLEGSALMAAAGAAITRDMLAVLPAHVKVFSNARTHYHCTVWHTSHPSDTRPDPFASDGGLNSTEAAAPPGQRPAVTQPVLTAEVEALTKEVAATAAPTLVVDRVVMAASGTLLITWVDPSGRVADLRKRLRSAFPGACARQATIIHTSLIRVVSDEQIGSETVSVVDEVCARWTQKLRGKRMVPEATWWVYEHEFSTIFGDKVHMKFQSA